MELESRNVLRRNCLLKIVIQRKIEGRMEVTERRGRRRKQLMDDLKENCTSQITIILVFTVATV